MHFMDLLIFGAMIIMFVSVFCLLLICVCSGCFGHNRKIKKEVIVKSVTPPYPIFAMHPQPVSVSILPTPAPASSHQTKPYPNVETPYPPPPDLGFHLRDTDEDLSPPRRCSLGTLYREAYPSTSRAPYSSGTSTPCSPDQPPSYNEALRHIPANRTTSLQ